MRFTQITFHHMPHSGPLGERIRELSTRLEEKYPQIRLCRVRVPGGDIVSVSRGTDAESVLRKAVIRNG